MKDIFAVLSFKNRLYIHYGACGAGGIITILGCNISQNQKLHPVAWIGIVLIAAGLLWRILFVKCPHCGDGLYQDRADLKNCPSCGQKLL